MAYRILFLAMLASLCGGCGTKANPAVCCVSQADCAGLGVDEQVRNCSDGLVCVDHMCGAPECELDVDCGGGATPFCSAGVCVACRGDADCGSTTPVCDEQTRACRGCSVDADCPSQACDFDTGACIDESSVLYASPTGSDQAACSQQQPCSIAKVVTAVSVAKPTAKLLAGVYNASLRIDRPISIHADGATLIATTGPAMLVVDAARARIYDLSIVNNNINSNQNDLGVLCQSEDNVNTPQLLLSRVAVDTQRQPIFINLCTLTVSQSTLRSPRNTSTHFTFIAANRGTASFDRSMIIGGSSIGALDADITITNSVIDSVLPRATEGALVTAGGSLSVAYTTIFQTPLDCDMGAPAACASAARSGICIENSIINNPSSSNNTITGANCRCDYCLISPQQTTVTGSNNLIGDPNFTNPAQGDLHLSAGSPAIDAAHPSIPGTPDYDGVVRPQNGRSDLGAFEFTP